MYYQSYCRKYCWNHVKSPLSSCTTDSIFLYLLPDLQLFSISCLLRLLSPLSWGIDLLGKKSCHLVWRSPGTKSPALLSSQSSPVASGPVASASQDGRLGLTTRLHSDWGRYFILALVTRLQPWDTLKDNKPVWHILKWPGEFRSAPLWDMSGKTHCWSGLAFTISL